MNQDAGSNYGPTPIALDLHTIQGLTPQDPYFDFSKFALPSDFGMSEGSDHWFSSDFFSALQETDWEQMMGVQENSLESSIPHIMNETAGNGVADKEYPNTYGAGMGTCLGAPVHQVCNSGEEDDHHVSGRISRLSSPPNEASLEDRTPFAWNPRSRRIAEAKDIVLSIEDPLLKQHNPRYDISESTFQRLKMFLLPHGQSFFSSMQDSFNLPALPITNAFINIFFERFAPQSPVLHKATLDTDRDLPPALLAIMVVIGAIYSRLRHTRRFAILALDRTRRHLQLAIEDDNALMRNPMIVYAAALVCYTGLWCGNKRAFELAEILRSAVVTYVRRMDNVGQSNYLASNSKSIHAYLLSYSGVSTGGPSY